MDPNGPFGAKEASEGPLAGFMSALAAAVEEATGLRFKALAHFPSRVFLALQDRDSQAAQAAQAASQE